MWYNGSIKLEAPELKESIADAVKDWGYWVPKDFSVIGFDNLGIGQLVEPGLTSVAQNVSELIDRS